MRKLLGSTQATWTILLALIFVATITFLGHPLQAETTCYTWSNSDLTYVSGYGWACGGWGPGCTECVDSGSAGSCVTNGQSCEPFQKRQEPIDPF
jgi:hypothetical protein